MPLRRRRGLVAAVAAAGWLALGVVVIGFVGLGGWRGGLVIATVWLAAGTALVAWLALGPSSVHRGLWATLAVAVGFFVGVQAAGAAPASTGRLAQRIDDMRIGNQLFTVVSEKASGHGWCSPHCPEVVRIYRSPNGSYQEGLVVAYVGLHQIGLEDNIKRSYDQQAGLVIRRHRGHLSAVVTVDRVDGRVLLTVDLQSRP